MSRMKAGRVAVLFAQIRRQFPEEVAELEGHYDAAIAEDSFTQLVREVGETIGAQRAFMEAQQRVLTAATEALNRFTEEQQRANELEERRQKQVSEETAHTRAMEKLQQKHEQAMAKVRIEHEQAMSKTKLEKILVPSIAAAVGALAGYLSTFLG